jgi:hypothetical protein
MKNDKFSINLSQFDDMSSLSSRHTSATYIKKRTDQSETSLISSSSESSDINEKESLLSEYDDDYDINKIYLHLKNLKKTKTTTTITKSDSIHIDYVILLKITILILYLLFFIFFFILPIFHFFISHNKLIVFNFI